MELVGEEEHEGVLTLTLLLDRLIFGRRWEIPFGFGSWIMAFMIFTIFYDRFLTDADEELNK